MSSLLLPILATLLLGAGCASLDSRPPGGQLAPTPRQMAAMDIPEKGTKVRWGGVIISIRNLQYNTEIDVISYPISSHGEPQPEEPPQGRFIALKAGYLEPLDYAPGRRVTLEGRVESRRPGTVGEAKYLFPILRVETIRLWSGDRSGPRPSFNFGFGIGSGGRASGGFGVGIGF